MALFAPILAAIIGGAAAVTASVQIVNLGNETTQSQTTNTGATNPGGTEIGYGSR